MLRLRRPALLLAALLLLTACGSKPGPFVQVLISIGESAPRDAQGHYADLLEKQVMAQLPNGTRLQLAPIDHRAFTASAVTINYPGDSLLSRPTGLEERKARQNQIAAAESALAEFAKRPAGSGTEIIGAVQAAAKRFQGAPGGKKLLILLTTGFEQSEFFNLYDTLLDLQQPQTIDQLLAKVKAGGAIPDLHGVTVCVAGITNGDDNNAPLRLVSGLEHWWRAYFSAAGATLASYGAGLEGCPISG